MDIYELSHPMVDYFVGLAEGENVKLVDHDGDPCCYIYTKDTDDYTQIYNPTNDPSIASVIIDREKISITPLYTQRGTFVQWEAKSLKWVVVGSGPTYITAALCAYIAHKFENSFSID